MAGPDAPDGDDSDASRLPGRAPPRLRGLGVRDPRCAGDVAPSPCCARPDAPAMPRRRLLCGGRRAVAVAAPLRRDVPAGVLLRGCMLRGMMMPGVAGGRVWNSRRLRSVAHCTLLRRGSDDRAAAGALEELVLRLRRDSQCVGGLVSTTHLHGARHGMCVATHDTGARTPRTSSRPCAARVQPPTSPHAASVACARPPR